MENRTVAKKVRSLVKSQLYIYALSWIESINSELGTAGKFSSPKKGKNVMPWDTFTIKTGGGPVSSPGSPKPKYAKPVSVSNEAADVLLCVFDQMCSGGTSVLSRAVAHAVEKSAFQIGVIRPQPIGPGRARKTFRMALGAEIASISDEFRRNSDRAVDVDRLAEKFDSFLKLVGWHVGNGAEFKPTFSFNYGEAVMMTVNLLASQSVTPGEIASIVRDLTRFHEREAALRAKAPESSTAGSVEDAAVEDTAVEDTAEEDTAEEEFNYDDL